MEVSTARRDGKAHGSAVVATVRSDDAWKRRTAEGKVRLAWV